MSFHIHPAFSRIGTESAFVLADKVKQAKDQGINVVNLGLGQPDFPTPEHITQAAIKAIQDGHHGYTPPLGIMPLRETVANYLNQRYDVDISPETVAIVPGGKPTMHIAISIFATPDAEIIYPDPSFPIYRSMIDYMGAKAMPLPLKAEHQFIPQIEDIKARLSAKTRLLIINSPHNPTGSVAPESFFRELETLLENYPDCAIMSDEIYSHFTFGDVPHFSMLKLKSLQDRLILLDGFSKSFAMTGWRLGFSVWPKALIPHVYHLAVNCYSCPNSITQHAGIAALTGDMNPVYAMRDAFAERASLMHEKFNAIENVSCTLPQGAFYIYPNFKDTGFAAHKLADQLLFEAGVGGLAGQGFGETGADHIRFSCVASPEDIARAIDNIGRWLTENQS